MERGHVIVPHDKVHHSVLHVHRTLAYRIAGFFVGGNFRGMLHKAIRITFCGSNFRGAGPIIDHG